ncbi:MAG: hypothetical protein PVJ78_06325, partial [Gammaproteobacteria bacterium]
MKRRLLIALAILLLAPLLLLGWLMNTESGLRWGYDMALLQLPGEFSAAEVSGSLAGPITLRGVDYQQQGVEVGAARIEVDWDPWELLTLRLHVTRLRIESLRLALPADADSAPARDAPIELPGFVMPIAMQLDGAQIEAIDIRRGESAYRIARIGLRLDAQYNRFEIGELEIEADEFSAHLDGRITAREGYPHAIDFEWHGSLPSGAEFDGKGNLAGDLSSTRLQQQVQGLVQFEHSLEIEDLLAKPHWRLTASTAEIDIRRLDPTLPGIRGTLVATAEGDLETATASGKLTGSEPRIGEFEANFRLRSLDGERRFEGIEVEALDVEALAGSIAAGGRVEWLPATRWTAEV